MRKYLIFILLTVSAFTSITVLQRKLQRAQKEVDRLEQTSLGLLADVESYKTVNNLNVARVGELQLKLKEFKAFRDGDARLIKELQTRNRELSRFNSVQTETINTLKTNVRDSIVYKDNVIIKELKCLKISKPYLYLEGCFNKNNEFEGVIKSKENLKIVVTLKRKRFLGFLWKTRRLKDTKVDVFSLNPNTEITKAEIVNIVN